jgi:dipeptidyl aminopeptidase/acylaminoacyl peptidase
MDTVCRLPRRWLVLIVVGIGLLTGSGCVPVTWLSDSSGFVYAKRHKAKNEDEPPAIQLVHFDLKQNAARVVVDRVVSNTNWPAVSPDGKRLAVARFVPGAKESWTVRMVLFDSDGKQIHESKPFAWPDGCVDNKEDRGANVSLLFWSPKGDKVVVTTMLATGCYDVMKDSMAWIIEQSAPLIHGGTPIRPDGKGCLLLIEGADKMRAALVHWDGSERVLDIAPLLAALPNKGGEGDIVGVPPLPLQLPSWWEGNAAVVGSKQGKASMRYDTGKKTISIVAAEKKGNLLERVAKENMGVYDLGNSISIRLIPDAEQKPGASESDGYCRVVSVDRQTGKEHTLLAKEAPRFFAVPSPDRRYLALHFFASDTLPNRIVVIGEKGDIAGKIELQQ